MARRPSDPTIHVIQPYKVRSYKNFLGHRRWRVWAPDGRQVGQFENWDLAVQRAARLAKPTSLFKDGDWIFRIGSGSTPTRGEAFQVWERAW